MDVYTRELLDMRVFDGVFADVIRRTKRKPVAVVHDHGARFRGRFARQLRVLEIAQELTPVWAAAVDAGNGATYEPIAMAR
jgi:hypothetical protein